MPITTNNCPVICSDISQRFLPEQELSSSLRVNLSWNQEVGKGREKHSTYHQRRLFMFQDCKYLKLKYCPAVRFLWRKIRNGQLNFNVSVAGGETNMAQFCPYVWYSWRHLTGHRMLNQQNSSYILMIITFLLKHHNECTYSGLEAKACANL